MCALVRGMTDILTPVNLLSNSDFSRNHLNIDVQTYNSVFSNTSATSRAIADGWYLRAYQGTFTNVTVTRATNSVTITATLDSFTSDSKYADIGIGRTFASKPSNRITRTFGFTIKNVTCSANRWYMEIPTQGTTYYANRESLSSTSMREVSIRNQAVNNSINLNFMAVVYDVGATITFTICDAFMYEGAFCNPPNDRVSLNVTPLNPFISDTDSPDKLTSLISVPAMSNKYWLRLVDIKGLLGTAYNTAIRVHLLIDKPFQGSGYSPTITDLTAILYCGESQMPQTSISTSYGIDAISTRSGSNASNMFSKFRIAKDTSNNHYIEAYCGHGLVTGVRIRYLSCIISNGYVDVHNASLTPSSFAGDDDTLTGREFGYRLPGSYTIVGP